MSKKRGSALHAVVTIWDKPEPERRPVAAPLSRARIVRAACLLADKEGLESVSLRKVGAALKAGPMRLYAYISTKDELFDLMVDALYAELAEEGVLAGEWKRAIRTHAQRLRGLTHRHPWFLPLMGGRPHQGPYALKYLESLLTVMHQSKSFRNIDQVLQALRTIQAYIIGSLQSEASELEETRASGLTKSEWQEAVGARLARMIGAGRLPTMEQVVTHASHPTADIAFLEGLNCVLDGVSVGLEKRDASERD